MAEIILQGINKVYPDGTHAVKDVDLHIQDGEFMIMVGPSGCAKSTILRMIAGLETPTGGTVAIGGRTVNDVAAKDRDIAMVFQSYALYPHMTVADNMAFGLKLRNMPPNEIEARIQEAAQILGLEQLLHRKPRQMSGGQRQRVAMGRAIVREPQAFLMDEPLSNLDAKLRVQMRTEIAKLHSRLNTTTVYVTHDQVEAMTLGQRICILRKGEIQQVDTPFMVYTNPANIFVAGFIGSPGMNFMSGRLSTHEGHPFLQLGDQTMPLPPTLCARLLEQAADREVVVGVRPEHMHETDGSYVGGNCLVADVDITETMGSEAFAYFTMRVGQPNLSDLDDARGSGGNPTFVAKLHSTTKARNGGQVVLSLDLEHLYLFDPRTQQSLLAPLHSQEGAAPIDAGIDLHSLNAAPSVAARQPVAQPVATQPIAAQAAQPAAHEAPMAAMAAAAHMSGRPLIERMDAAAATPYHAPMVAGTEAPLSSEQLFGAHAETPRELAAHAVFGSAPAGPTIAASASLRFPGTSQPRPAMPVLIEQPVVDYDEQHVADYEEPAQLEYAGDPAPVAIVKPVPAGATLGVRRPTGANAQDLPRPSFRSQVVAAASPAMHSTSIAERATTLAAPAPTPRSRPSFSSGNQLATARLSAPRTGTRAPGAGAPGGSLFQRPPLFAPAEPAQPTANA